MSTSGAVVAMGVSSSTLAVVPEELSERFTVALPSGTIIVAEIATSASALSPIEIASAVAEIVPPLIVISLSALSPTEITFPFVAVTSPPVIVVTLDVELAAISIAVAPLTLPPSIVIVLPCATVVAFLCQNSCTLSRYSRITADCYRRTVCIDNYTGCV